LHQGFELSRVFKISAKVASPSDIRAVLGWYAHPRVMSVLRRKRMSWLRPKCMAIESHLHRSSNPLDELPSRCYMEGYWQSEKYFKSVAELIRSEFTFATALNAINEKYAAQIAVSNSISLHVRRGDYASNPRTLAIHGLLPLDYYHRAVDFISQRVPDPTFFIFSDDMNWVRENLRIPHPCHFVTCNSAGDSYNDMRLMSMCRHHVIANSSFSWWGAWLNPSEDKIVIAPKRWFTERDSSELIPNDWVRL
jgi:hypothetical protein